MRVLTPKRMREIESYAIATYGIDGLLLMERAALALAEEVLRGAPEGRPLRVLLVCGSGNNGGDAYACARMLHLRGARVTLLPLCALESLPPDAQKNARICRALGVPERGLDGAFDVDVDVIVDGIFGTGLSRAPQEDFARAIAGINRAAARGTRVLSVDIPSGVDGASGRPLGEAVRAETTVTFQWAKRGHFLYPGAGFCGRLVVADIGIPDPVAGFLPEDAEVLDAAAVRALLPVRARDAHKNDFGHALLVAGSRGMAGAAVLAATACMRAGTGLLTALVPERSVLPQVQAAVPVAMCLPLSEGADGRVADDAAAYEAALAGKTAVGVGPGLGRAPGRAEAVRAALRSGLPAVVDADGLFHLAAA
ncbi:MAG: NAD(P)H-hydrate epimerase, partial [Candidatus Spyradocola sp.]